VGAIRRVSISNVVVSGADPRYGSIVSGIPGHNVEDVKLSGIRILYRGGLTLDQVAKQPADLVNTFFFRAQGGFRHGRRMKRRSAKRNIPSLPCSDCRRRTASSSGTRPESS